MRWFLRESYNDGATLKRLPKKAVCPRHAAIMLEGDNRHLSITFEFLTKVRLAEPGGQGRGTFMRRGGSKTPDPRPCFLCEVGSHAARVAVIDTVKLIDFEDGRAAYLGHDGLCLAHHDEAVGEAEPETASWLEAQLRPRLESMLTLFELYRRHIDVRFQHEPKGEEQQAWRRALCFFWGDAVNVLESDQFVPWESVEGS